MSLGDENSLTLTIRMRVRPESKCEEEFMNLLRRYRGALNHSIKKIAENKAKTSRKLYRIRQRRFKLAVNAMVKTIVEDAHQLGISRIVLGRLRGE
jgi:hypothetical protein